MKKRRNVLFAFALLALLVIGFGYASLTDNVIIDTTAGGTGAGNPSVPGSGNEEDESLFDIQWVTGSAGATATPAAGSTSLVGATASVVDAENATLTITNMAIKGDKVVATYEVTVVECPDGYDAKLAYELNGTVGAGLVDVQIEFADAVVAKGDKTTVTVTATLKATLISDEDTLNYAVTIKVIGEPTK